MDDALGLDDMVGLDDGTGLLVALALLLGLAEAVTFGVAVGDGAAVPVLDGLLLGVGVGATVAPPLNSGPQATCWAANAVLAWVFSRASAACAAVTAWLSCRSLRVASDEDEPLDLLPLGVDFEVDPVEPVRPDELELEVAAVFDTELDVALVPDDAEVLVLDDAEPLADAEALASAAVSALSRVTWASARVCLACLTARASVVSSIVASTSPASTLSPTATLTAVTLADAGKATDS